MGQGNFIMISFVRGFAPNSAHALPIAGFGQGSLLARNLTWGLARRRTLPSFNDRGTLLGECLSVWGLEGPTSTSADLFNVSGAPTRDESSLGRRLDAGGGPLEISGSPCSTIIITSLHGSRGKGFQVATGQLSNGGVRKNCGRLVWLGAWGTKGARVPRFQGSRVPRLQGRRVARLQGCKVAGLQGSRIPRLQGSKVPGLQACKVARSQGGARGVLH